MNKLDKISVDLSVLADQERYGMRDGSENALRDAAREIDAAADSLCKAADGILLAALEIKNLSALAAEATKEEGAKNIHVRIRAQIDTIQELAKVVREGGGANG